MSRSEHLRPAEHAVRFYQQDAHLCEAVAEFAADGLALGERVVLLVTEGHRLAIADLIVSEHHIDVDAADERGQLVWVGAEELAGRVLQHQGIEASGFAADMERALGHAARTRVFGEVVSLIAGQGALDLALQVEEVGRELAHAGGVTVLCAYHLEHLAPGRRDLERVIACHDRVITTLHRCGLRPSA